MTVLLVPHELRGFVACGRGDAVGAAEVRSRGHRLDTARAKLREMVLDMGCRKVAVTGHESHRRRSTDAGLAMVHDTNHMILVVLVKAHENMDDAVERLARAKLHDLANMPRILPVELGSLVLHSCEILDEDEAKAHACKCRLLNMALARRLSSELGMDSAKALSGNYDTEAAATPLSGDSDTEAAATPLSGGSDTEAAATPISGDSDTEASATLLSGSCDTQLVAEEMAHSSFPQTSSVMSV